MPPAPRPTTPRTRRRPRVAVPLLAAAAVTGAAAITPLLGQPSPDPAALARVDFAKGWIIACSHSHDLPDDPIVFPGRAGASHLHSFFGARGVDASSTVESILASTAGTSCEFPDDTAAYWVPSLYYEGRLVRPNLALFYYRAFTDHRTVRTMPPGLRMIAGDARATGPQSAEITDWGCPDGEGRLNKGFTGHSMPVPAPLCDNPDGRVFYHLYFPDCWDGRNLDSADHKSHMAYSQPNPSGRDQRVCPASHPVPVPAVRFKISYRGIHDVSRVTLSSGAPYTLHGDFMMTWKDQPLFDRLVRECITDGTSCDEDDVAAIRSRHSSTPTPNPNPVGPGPSPPATPAPRPTTTPRPATAPRPVTAPGASPGTGPGTGVNPSAGGSAGPGGTVPAPRAGTMNLVANPSFERTVRGWRAQNARVSRARSSRAPSGRHVARVARTSGASYAIHGLPAVVRSTPSAGALYTASVQVRAARPSAAGKPVLIELLERDRAGRVVRRTGSGAVRLTARFRVVSVQARAVASGHRIEVVVRQLGAAAGDAFEVDGFSVTPVHAGAGSSARTRHSH